MLDSFDHIFWFGDLNYRVELTRDQADQYLANSDWMVSITFALHFLLGLFVAHHLFHTVAFAKGSTDSRNSSW